jgi:hypothetical protein
MAAFLDNCRFIPAAGGTTDWVYASAVGGCQSPAAGGVVTGTKYKFLAISADLTQWEIAEGVCTITAGPVYTFARTNVLYNSAGTGSATGQTGGGGKITFTAAPNVAIVAVKEDLISVEEPNSFTTVQQVQARANIAATGSPQCGRLSFVSATALQFLPYGGSDIRINGVILQIPSAGIAGLANTGVYLNGVAGQNLAASTLYYVYAFNNAGTLTADFSTTGHAMSTQAGNIGTEIKNGDNTRTLLGMVYTNASAQFSASGLVLSWFNRRNLTVTGNTASNPSTTSTSSWVNLGSVPMFGILNWGDEAVFAEIVAAMSGTWNYAGLAVGIDGSAGGATGNLVGIQPLSYVSSVGNRTGGWATPSEGYHGYWLAGISGNGGAVTYNNTNANGMTRG